MDRITGVFFVLLLFLSSLFFFEPAVQGALLHNMYRKSFSLYLHHLETIMLM